MPRHPRVHASGLLYCDVMARRNNGQKIFPEAKDYEVFLEQPREMRRRYPFYLYAYVLMPNHFQLEQESQVFSDTIALMCPLFPTRLTFHPALQLCP